MASKRQDEDFAEEMNGEVKISDSALLNAISWIKKHLDPDDVFDDKSLSNWAESNGYVKE